LDKRPIGVFDSGVGGLTVVKELIKIMPNEDIIYFGDTGRVPYGTRGRDTIIKYAQQDVSFLLKHNVKMIIAACGTASAVLPDEYTKKLPIPYTGIIQSATQAACGITKTNKIGVIATNATINSGAYGKLIRSINENIQVFGNACPLFVPLAENGFIERENEITRLAAKMYLQDFAGTGIDTLILGCTHYPLLYEIIDDVLTDILKYKVSLINPGEQTAIYTRAFLNERNMLNSADNEAKYHYYVTDNTESFEQIAVKFMRLDIKGDIEYVSVEKL